MAKAKAKTEEQTTDLIPLTEVNAAMVFEGAGKDLDTLLNKITKSARAVVLDVTTEKGRKEIKSLTYNIARTKTTIDDAGKEYATELKTRVKLIDERRKHARDTLDELKADIREPLDDYEAAEEARIHEHTSAIDNMRSAGNRAVELHLEMSLDELEQLQASIEGTDPSTFEEFAENATETRLAALAKIDTAIEKRKQYDRDQAELAELRRKQAEQEEKDRKAAEEKAQKERDERIAREAREKAEREAQAEQERLEREKREAEERAAQAERDAAEAEERAMREHEEKLRREQEEKDRRERNTKHKGAINRQAAQALVEGCKLTDEQAKDVIKAIAKSMIPNVTINY